jgi:hypothetical protein
MNKEELKPRNGVARIYQQKVVNRLIDREEVVESIFQRLDDRWVEIQHNTVAYEFDQYLNDGIFIYLKDRERPPPFALARAEVQKMPLSSINPFLRVLHASRLSGPKNSWRHCAMQESNSTGSKSRP